MTEEPYDPVSCDYHDQLEAAAMHRKPVELEFELDGAPQRARGTVEDVYTTEGAEFIRFAAPAGPLVIRLDHIVSMKD